ncbi:hypothetical protein [Tautonia marina]|uniref:hypothetical protein n=1 Tax=Tautonia marina TaxID=2653855 RepID=UPI001260FD9A|nr:hypothetical protein [Tautonia marina]
MTPTNTTPAEALSEREAFEKWMKKRGTPLFLEHPQAYDAWCGRGEYERTRPAPQPDAVPSAMYAQLLVMYEKLQAEHAKVLSAGQAATDHNPDAMKMVAPDAVEKIREAVRVGHQNYRAAIKKHLGDSVHAALSTPDILTEGGIEAITNSVVAALLPTLAPAQEPVIDEAIRCLENMAERWALRVNLTDSVEAIKGAPSAIEAFLHQAYMEGLYEGCQRPTQNSGNDWYDRFWSERAEVGRLRQQLTRPAMTQEKRESLVQVRAGLQRGIETGNWRMVKTALAALEREMGE